MWQTCFPTLQFSSNSMNGIQHAIGITGWNNQIVFAMYNIANKNFTSLVFKGSWSYNIRLCKIWMWVDILCILWFWGVVILYIPPALCIVWWHHHCMCSMLTVLYTKYSTWVLCSRMWYSPSLRGLYHIRGHKTRLLYFVYRTC